LPGRDWLVYQLREVEQVMRATTWAPLTPAEIFRLAESRDRLLVRSPQDLIDLLVDTLRKYGAQLHGEQTPIRDLWDRQADGTFRPIEEDSLSNHVNRFLRHELTDAGIVANREVEVVRVFGPGIGSRTDIRINALRRSPDGTDSNIITAVIETKGNWHSGLFTALNDQLYVNYLVPLQARVGIYLVGWFDKAKWDPTDPRRKAAPNDLHDVQDQLDAQAAGVPAGYLVRAVVLDCHAL
jgi:hypothetical protein